MFNKSGFIISSLIFTSLISSNAVLAAQPVKPHSAFSFLLGAGLTFGGDDLIKVHYSNGQSEELTAGGLIDFKAGFRYQAEDSPLVFQTSIGYHFDSVDADNGDADFVRYPIDALIFYNHNEHFFGLGASYHMNPKLDIDFGALGLDLSEKVDDELGLVVEYNYKFTKDFSLAVRYLDISYNEADGSHFGIYGYIHF